LGEEHPDILVSIHALAIITARLVDDKKHCN
jgi:hypothetical protein